jgi:hypothetical protein
MSKALRGILLGTIWVALFLASGPHPVPAQESEESAWLKSGDPCRPTKQHIKQLEAVGGAKGDYIKCRPVRISLTWDFDETYHHHSNLGDDRFGVGLTVSFPGYIQIAYNQMNRRQVDDVAIRGPAPCCPGEAEFLPTRLEASILGAAPGARGDKLKFFQAGAPEITYRRAAAGGLSLVWRRDGLNNQLGIVGPRFGLAKDVIPKPYQWKFAPTVMQSDEYRVKKVRDESPSWDEIRPFFDKEDVWRREYPLDDRQNLPGTAEFYAIHGRVAVQVDFAALEREEWLVTVRGRERSPVPVSVEYEERDKSPQVLMLDVEFDWQLEGRFVLTRRKGVRSYSEGVITAFIQTPRLLVEPSDVFRCQLAPACEGRNVTEEMGRLASLFLLGQLQGQSVKLAWPDCPSLACVLCTPLKSWAGKTAQRKKFGTSEFIKRVSGESIPLKDGAVRTGGIPDWLTYQITVRKLK